MRRKKRDAGFGPLLVAFALLAAGCADDSCDELAAVCAGCPETGFGVVAAAACEDTVAKGDVEACAQQVEAMTYRAYGCE